MKSTAERDNKYKDRTFSKFNGYSPHQCSAYVLTAEARSTIEGKTITVYLTEDHNLTLERKLAKRFGSRIIAEKQAPNARWEPLLV